MQDQHGTGIRIAGAAKEDLPSSVTPLQDCATAHTDTSPNARHPVNEGQFQNGFRTFRINLVLEQTTENSFRNLQLYNHIL